MIKDTSSATVDNTNAFTKKPAHRLFKYRVKKVPGNKRVLPATREWLQEQDSERIDLLWAVSKLGYLEMSPFQDVLKKAKDYLKEKFEQIGYEFMVEELNFKEQLHQRAQGK